MNEPERILSESAWMRRVAFALVRDAALADDVVQKAWVRALSGAPEGAASLRHWLARVVRNLSLHELRTRERRAERESAAQGSKRAQDAPGDVLARLDAHKQLFDALAQLPEPYRRTVTSRYLDGLSPAEIARRERVPAGTVRWRLSRALELLRADLDRRHDGGRREWCLALLADAIRPPFPPPPATLAGAVAPGIFLMNATTKALLLLAAGLATTLAVSLFVSRPDLGAGGDVLLSEHVAEPAVPPAAAPAGPTAAYARVSVLGDAPPAGDREPPPSAPAAAPPSAALLRARVLDSLHNPLAGAVLAVPELHLRGASGFDGTLALEIPFAETRTRSVAEVSSEDCATRWVEFDLEPGTTTLLGDVVLESGASVAGIVLAPDGTPEPGARVVVTGPDLFGPARRSELHGPDEYPGAPSALTDGSGAFTVRGVASGSRRVWASALGSRFAWSAPLHVQAPQSVDGLLLRLMAEAPEDWISGVVLDPSGAPLPAARLSLEFQSASWSSSRGVPLDLDARFRQRVELDGPHDLRATDPAGRWPAAVARGVAPGSTQIELRFREPAALELGVRSAAGEPLEGFDVAAERADDGDRLAAPRSVPLAPGRARVFLPNEPCVLVVAAHGYATERSDVLDPNAPPSELSFRLAPRAGVSGVVRARGALLEGATVLLARMPGDGRCYQKDGFDLRFSSTELQEGVTDAHGRFALTPPEQGDFALLVHADGFAVAELGPFALYGPQGIAGIEVELVGGGALEGHVLVPPGARPAGVIVGINRGDAFPRTLRVGEDGRFRFEHLAAGRWQVSRVDRLLGLDETFTISGCDSDEFRSDCTVADGRTTRFDLDLSDARPCALSGELALNGRPAAGATIVLMPASGVVLGGRERPSTVADGEGRFELASDEPGLFRLDITLPGETASRLVSAVSLERGPTTWSLDLDTARLVVHRPEPVSDEITLVAHGERWDFYANVSDGGDTPIVVPAGTVELGRYLQRPGAALSEWSPLEEVSLARGQQQSVVVP